MAILIRARFPLLLLLLGIVFLASVSVSVGFAYWEKENPRHHGKCMQSCNSENDAYRYRACQARCNLIKKPEEQRREREEREGQQQEEERPRCEEQQERQPRREREHQREEEEEEERGPREHRHCHQEREQEQEPWLERERESEEEEQEEREPREQRHRHQEREREQERREEEEKRQREERQRSEERQREEKQRRREKKEQKEEREGQGSQPQKQSNPFHFGPKKFQTRYKSQHGQVRILQRFDQRSKQLRNLQNYRIVVFESKPNTLILPHHSDAEYLLVVLSGKATFTIVNPNNRESYNVERGDVLRIPAGTTAYIVNRDDNQSLRVAKLAIPVNTPGQFEDFFPSGSQNPQSYYKGFSRDTLEATFNTQYEEIERILLGEEEEEEQQQRGREGEQSQQEEGVIVKVSKEQIRELSQHAKSVSRGGKPSKSGPFNLRSLSPRYSNKFGKFYEASPEKTRLLQDLGIYVSYTELNEGGLFLPHYNSKAIVLALVIEGKGGLEIVDFEGHRKPRKQSEEGREEEQEEEEEEEEEKQQERRSGKVPRMTVNLSQGDVFIAPAGHPIAINASSDLHVLAFGLNAENNQRNFLGGARDNVIKQIERQAKELAFPGSGEDVDSLIRNQRESYFVNAQPQQREGRQGRRGPLSSILGAFY